MFKCPRCVQIIHAGAGECPHCGFFLSLLDEICAGEDRETTRVDDQAGLLRRDGRGRVMKRVRRFERRFPQLWWFIHTRVRSPETDLRQFSFWLLNRAEIGDVPEGRSRGNALLLVIDPGAKRASMAWGYGLDACLDEEASFLAMSRAHGYWLEGLYSEGILRVIEEMSGLLCRRVRRLHRRGGRG